jgi:hypothetical protein
MNLVESLPDEQPRNILSNIFFITVNGVKKNKTFHSQKSVYRYIDNLYNKTYINYSNCNLYIESELSQENLQIITLSMTEKNSLFPVEKNLYTITVEMVELYKNLD